MKLAVLDTSALIRFYIPDGPIPAGLEETIDSCLQGETTVLIPELALVEAAQVLYKKERAQYITPDEADEILQAILELPLERIGHYDLIQAAYELARKLRITVYDAVFLTLARNRGATLITSDEELLRAFTSQPTLSRLTT